MSAYMVVHMHLRDTAWVKDYVANVPTILRSFGGEYLAVSKQLQQFEGEGPAPHQVALFTFPSLEAMNAFMNCAEYAPYKQARIDQSSALIVGFET